MIVNYLYHLWP